MRPLFRATLSALLSIPALLWPAALGAAPQQAAGAPPISVERIREELERPPAPRLSSGVTEPLRPTFRSTADRRIWVPTLKEHLHKTFDLTPMQRQSAEWAAQCCGIKIGQVVKLAENALRARKVRKTREEIARELPFIEAARMPPPK